MFNKKSLKNNLLITLLVALLISLQGYTQVIDNPKEEQHHRFDYRRLDPNNLPPIEKYTQPKEEVFPLGYSDKSETSGTNHLNKVTSGTGVWTELNPKVPRVTYIGLHFVNKDTGWACGQSGAVIKTMDGGSSWTISGTPVNNLLLKTHSYNGQIVLVTGYDGIILRSSDGGENFVQVTSGVGNGFDLWGVQMLNDTLGWVCGLNQTLLKTTDAGINWQLVSTGLNQHYWSLDFIDEQYGMIACSGGKILKTTDGGNSWLQLQAGDTRALYTIDIIDSLHIAAAGANGKNVYSSDGGTTWISNPDIIAATSTNCIDFIDADTGYSVQDVYNIRKTTNRGQSWFNPTGTYFLSEWHIQLLEDGTGYSCGEEVGGGYALNFYKRTNGLENWSRLFINDNFNDVYFTTEQNGFALSTLLYETVDAGMNWQKVVNAPGGYDIVFTDSLIGFIGTSNSAIYKTIDGGANWYLTNVPAPVGDFRKIFFINSTTGWAGTIWTPTSNANILKTTDGGENWFVQAQQSGVDGYTSIFFVDSLNGWATSRYVWQTTNGGSNWIQRTDIQLYFTRDIYFTDMDTGFVAEGFTGNDLYVTIDGGLNWQRDTRIENAFNFNYFPNKYHWISNGGINQIWETTDNGSNWIEITEDVPTGFNRFQAPKEWIGYAIGSAGLILKYEDTSNVPVELISFEGTVENNKIILYWQTASELNNRGFQIEKSFDKINWFNIGFVEGRGTTTENNYYSFIDNEINSGVQFYLLKQQDYNGAVSYSQIVVIEIRINSFSLFQNFPNPANPSTTISFSIPVRTNLKINLYSVVGELVKVILDEEKEKGFYSINVDLSNLASGIYFYKIITSVGYMDVKKLILIQ